jgi:hypothetical protein
MAIGFSPSRHGDSDTSTRHASCAGRPSATITSTAANPLWVGAPGSAELEARGDAVVCNQPPSAGSRTLPPTM